MTKFTTHQCEACKGQGYLYTLNHRGDDAVERCDECMQFKTDAEASEAADRAYQAAFNQFNQKGTDHV